MSQKWSKKNNKIPFSIINNQFSLARMEKPLWPDCLSISDKNYINYLENNNISHFGWSSQARGFFRKDKLFKKFSEGIFINILKENNYSMIIFIF